MAPGAQPARLAHPQSRPAAYARAALGQFHPHSLAARQRHVAFLEFLRAPVLPVRIAMIGQGGDPLLPQFREPVRTVALAVEDHHEARHMRVGGHALAMLR